MWNAECVLTTVQLVEGLGDVKRQAGNPRLFKEMLKDE